MALIEGRFYWVLVTGSRRPVVAEWSVDSWWFCGEDSPWGDWRGHVTVLSEALEPPPCH